LAGKSHGVVRRADLVAAGITAAEIKGRVAASRAPRGLPGRAQGAGARYFAAVWACGEGALLCGLAAAHLLGLVSGAARIFVT
jgi:hypothetical protein